MSDVEKPVAPAGEEIHLPGGSLQPLLVATGITITLLGLTFSIVLVIGGALLTIWQIVNWVRDTRADIEELPAHHGEH